MPTAQYTLTIPADHVDTYAIGVIPPTNEWLPTDPGHDGVENVFAGPGSPMQIVNFFLDPPATRSRTAASAMARCKALSSTIWMPMALAMLAKRASPNFRVFIDANENGVWDSATEQSVLTASNGAYFFCECRRRALIRLDIVIPNEGTPAAAWTLTTPALGYRTRNARRGRHHHRD